MKKKNIRLTRYLLVIPLVLGLSVISPQHVKAQQPPAQGNPPPPPPSPAEVLDKINPFKKKQKAPESTPKNDKEKKADQASPAGGPPPPPPNPLDLFKKKKTAPDKPTSSSR
jgi:hypothetical protein